MYAGTIRLNYKQRRDILCGRSPRPSEMIDGVRVAQHVVDCGEPFAYMKRRDGKTRRAMARNAMRQEVMA
jgi:hypothetical protein